MICFVETDWCLITFHASAMKSFFLPAHTQSSILQRVCTFLLVENEFLADLYICYPNHYRLTMEMSLLCICFWIHFEIQIQRVFWGCTNRGLQGSGGSDLESGYKQDISAIGQLARPKAEVKLNQICSMIAIPRRLGHLFDQFQSV